MITLSCPALDSEFIITQCCSPNVPFMQATSRLWKKHDAAPMNLFHSTGVTNNIIIALLYSVDPVNNNSVTMSTHNTRTLKLKQLNGIQPSFFWLFTSHVTMASVKKVYYIFCHQHFNEPICLSVSTFAIENPTATTEAWFNFSVSVTQTHTGGLD